jgi:hypothetical protein
MVPVTQKTSQNEHLVVRKWSKARGLGKAITVGTAASTVTVTNVADGPALAADGAGDAVVVWNSALSSTRAAVYGRRLSHTGRLVAPSGLAPVTCRISPSPRSASA